MDMFRFPSCWLLDKVTTFFSSVARAGFYKALPVLDFINDALPKVLPKTEAMDANTSVTKRQLKEIREFLGNSMKVEADHYNHSRTLKITSVGPEDSSYSFDQDGKKTSVQAYFKKRYKITLKYPRLPCLNFGKDGETRIPMELCRIAPNQRKRGQLPKSFTEFATINPKKRLEEINNILKQGNFYEDKGLKSLGIQVSPKFRGIQARILEAPTIKMQRAVTVTDGSWRIPCAFATPRNLTNWVFIDFTKRIAEADAKKFVYSLCQLGTKRGMAIESPLYCSDHVTNTEDGNNFHDSTQLLRRICKDYPSCKFFMCVVVKSSKLYKVIKTLCDRELMVLTQCIGEQTVKSCLKLKSTATLSNVLQKINCKLGGTCHTVEDEQVIENPRNGNLSFKEFLKGDILVMGADVNHPAPNNRDSALQSPSIVAVVGSCDRHATVYATEVRHQQRRLEYIEDMKRITMALLRNYYTLNWQKKPSHIVFYRDGVSNSQFLEVGQQIIKLVFWEY